jgi:RimJ/RimL family protein N-acetyltransferase
MAMALTIERHHEPRPPVREHRTRWIERPPLLVGPVVQLREVGPDDAATFHELFANPSVTRHVSPPPDSEAAFNLWVARARLRRLEGRGVSFAIVIAGTRKPIGLCQLVRQNAGWSVAEWGCVLAAAFWGTGVFAETARLLFEFASALGVRRLVARTDTTNYRANAALNKLGLSPAEVVGAERLWVLES